MSNDDITEGDRAAQKASALAFISAFQPLWNDVKAGDAFPATRPLLAHYTSVEALERIMASGQLWFSNPLYMNDWEELRFGTLEGATAFRRHDGIKRACGSDDRYQTLLGAFDRYFNEFEQKHAFDTYVLCLSEPGPVLPDCRACGPAECRRR